MLDQMRQQQDPLADKVVSHYFPDKKTDLQEVLDAMHRNDSVLPQHAPQSLVDVLAEIRSIAADFQDDETQIGVKFFDKYASDVLMLLGLLSLPYCYAAAKGAEVLVRSERILNEPERRLSETAQFVFEVMAKNAFSPKGRGIVSILKVRLMHATVRWYINNSADWNTEEYGHPINQEDMAGTNLSFSLMVIRGLRRFGKLVKAEDAFGYIKYWNGIGRMLGVVPELLPKDSKEAFVLEKKIRERHFKESEAGKKLTESLFEYFIEASKNTPLEGKVISFANFLLTDEVFNILGLEILEEERVLFKPYTIFMQLSNLVMARGDSYAKAYLNYKKQMGGGDTTSSGYQLP